MKGEHAYVSLEGVGRTPRSSTRSVTRPPPPGFCFEGRRADFLYGPVFGCVKEEQPSSIVDRPKLDEISFFMHFRLRFQQSEILQGTKVVWILERREAGIEPVHRK